ncbi:MAG TPA: hypothetical protein VGY48_23720 [Vicinamibacterales bacterium]|nr:hypothetical protein [Vicinamibacterales bacterium]
MNRTWPVAVVLLAWTTTIGTTGITGITGVTLRAQSRPLPTEAPEGIGAGNVLVGTATDYTRDERFSLSGLSGNLWRVGLMRLVFGISDIADFELTGGLRDHLSITASTPAPLSNLLQLTDPTSTGAFDDIIVATKIRVLAEESSHPAVGFRFGTRLPNAKHPSGLGQNTTDAYGLVTIGQAIGAARFVANAGLGILGDPLQANRHVSSFLYGATITSPRGTDYAIVIGVDGRTGPAEPGLESRSTARAGVMWKRGPARLEVDGTWGLTRLDGNVGVAASAAYVFHAFTP